MVAGAQREPARLDRAAARAPFLERRGDARLGGAVAQQPFARRVGQDLPLGIDDDGRDRRAPVLAGLDQVVEERPARQSERAAEDGADAAVGREHRHRQDDDRLARDARRRHPVDHRPLVAQRIPEVLAVGDAGARVARALVVADRENGAVEGDDEDARKERRQHRFPLQQLVEARRLVKRRQRQAQGDAAQGALQGDEPLRDRRRQALRVVFLRCQNDLLGGAADFAQHEDDRQRDARQDQQRAGQGQADLERTQTERFSGRAHSWLFGTSESLPHPRWARCVNLLARTPPRVTDLSLRRLSFRAGRRLSA